MAAHAAAYYNQALQYHDDSYRLIPQESLESMMKDYFGKTFHVPEAANIDFSMVKTDEQGNVLLSNGDWGEQVPRFDITDISFAEDKSGDAIVTVEYGAYDYWLNVAEPCGYVVNYRMKEDKDSKYGFIIVDMQSFQNQVEYHTSDWAEAYINYLQYKCNNKMNEGYVLIYVDDNDIPELVEIGDCEATGCHINTFYSGNAFTTQLDRFYFSYIERENRLCNSEGLKDCYYDVVYSIVDGRLVELTSDYYGATDNSNVQWDENGNPIYEYEWDGMKISEKEYQEKLNQVYDQSKAKDGYEWNSWYGLDDMIRIHTVS